MDWVTNSGGEYGLPPGTITHHRRRALDLVIVSGSLSPQVTECYVNTDLDVTSDHKVDFTTIEFGNFLRDSDPNGKFQLGKLDEKIFVTTLNAQRDMLQSELRLAQNKTNYSESRKKPLDRCAEKVIKAIHKSLELSIPRIKNLGCGEPWWNDKCRCAVLELRQARQRYIFETDTKIQNLSAEQQTK